MKLTRRGLGVLAVVVVGYALARAHGPRSLGALIITGAVALGAAALQVAAVGDPTMSRKLPRRATVGDIGTVELAVEAASPFLGELRDALPPGFTTTSPTGDDREHGRKRNSNPSSIPNVGGADGADSREGGADSRDATPRGGQVNVAGLFGGSFGGSSVCYSIRFAARGRWQVGPARIVIRDVLGLVEQEVTVGGTDTVLVCPRPRLLSPSGLRQLLDAAGAGVTDEREAFDRLREYQPGDSLRTLNWRVYAKYDEFVVTEYAANEAEQVTIAASAATDTDADVMAEAAASIALSLLSRGVPVTLVTPEGDLEAAIGDREAVLTHLALVGPGDVGSVNGDTTARVRVHAADGRVRVRIGDTETRFAALVDEPDGDDPGGRSGPRRSEIGTKSGSARRGGAVGP